MLNSNQRNIWHKIKCLFPQNDFPIATNRLNFNNSSDSYTNILPFSLFHISTLANGWKNSQNHYKQHFPSCYASNLHLSPHQGYKFSTDWVVLWQEARCCEAIFLGWWNPSMQSDNIRYISNQEKVRLHLLPPTHVQGIHYTNTYTHLFYPKLCSLFKMPIKHW